MILFSSDISKINWEEAAEIFRLAPLGTRAPEKLKSAFENSFSRIFVYDEKKLIGLGRAVCDGEYQAAIFDIVLLPQYQKRGIGKNIIKKLESTLPVDNIILYAVPGKDGFYKKCGYRKMLTGYAKFNDVKSNPESGYLSGQ